MKLFDWSKIVDYIFTNTICSKCGKCLVESDLVKIKVGNEYKEISACCRANIEFD